MTDLATLIEQRDRLQELLASGLKQVRTGDKWLAYGDQAELQRTLAALNRQIADAQRTSIKTIIFETSKGA